jgi:hypothetical protein
MKNKAEKIISDFCDRHGQIKFGSRVPAGMCLIMRGPESVVRDTMSARARWSYPTQRGGHDSVMLVPGIPEARTEKQAMDALFRFVDWIKEKPVSRELP